ncbi:ankyrin repeat and SOCS box protein 3 [Nerophis lumbriciformis]|uniref:ankyrin repeat and SOCS box protein 3 n=1 Tax=Nerophis lumbriciformis TaxID=546530 RepID=UPI002AE04D0F|nr:ankyrin repeat and SOCS box protein 3-like [Nerophis lumbriciformis]XP_061782772.1 ankyrin repeat and SOCS box protein 3-like [Nerophis lumbriciformis]XP_061782773.1 ankyrin repeat and SOCS box protein 3-like [Nerophis lumbriciformis]
MDFAECYDDTVSCLAKATRGGCRRIVRKLIREGHSVDCHDNRGWTALHEAAAASTVGCLKEILSAAALTAGPSFINSATHEGESACYLAAKRGCLAMVRILLRAGANINQSTNDLSSPLYAAVSGNHRDVVRLLLDKGARVNGNHSSFCWTCLHQAVFKGHEGVVSMLAGVAHLEARDDNGLTPLFLAAQHERRTCLKVLVEAGANVNTQAADMATPLLIACQEGHAACVDVLLEHAADPNMTCSKDWPQLPIHAAAEFGHCSIVRRLVPATERRCDRGEGMVSPVYSAVQGKHLEVLKLLLNEGFSPDGQDCDDLLGYRSPFAAAVHEAHLADHNPLISVLLEAGARLKEDDWTDIVRFDKRPLLEEVLSIMWITPPESGDSAAARRAGKRVMTQQELRDMLRAVLGDVLHANYWLPGVLQAGLEPTLLLQPNLLGGARSDVVNYLLHFVNWSTLSHADKVVLGRRRAEETWQPHPHFDSIPTLAHLCRLEVRQQLGPDVVMRTDCVQQLPVPCCLQDFLRFRDIPKPSD